MATQLAVMPRNKETRRELAGKLAPIRHLLTRLKCRIGAEPELEEAILRLEVLLGELTTSSGGML